ncbi:4-hydroxybenzoate polyprenyltransferase [Synechococcus sp. Cruz-9H2]|uniref:4-hydroxybenzoate polyprenyltransferase n=1 Tax=unclassified Synechococcus TaxID=2626047 RepID=UPI0020CEA50B|nr:MULTISPECIES: 4-hydroxybenzoate polyprenyltransferase [unclassified Synechococcus]MCP9818694.1 4-hydroxybenzoate polyprenyltransferase [Synechococcus sp. Cruz-9H2]MCP9842924.1 4-hydroxybenzoate polyprenyltransferase [Synechococcus sp. Edmonson 11F2]MCP9855949.1 4-hydroxybenzoate polyprenyltransferase [Synechococcus sp. Cruz-9C9]MCP9862164.1 4-hydroxybenzoate polyprenyltransferase [Synechococcus sp. Cruz-7E5]MCP9869435.1 4-hydroxybenzoate polyprenyltransferase [Synechococcus sp. Cruz-7B9]
MNIRASLRGWFELLRWHKPSGRLILLIPAGWALWLTPQAPPAPYLVGLIVAGGLAVSGAGCVANDLWDRRIDPLVERTRTRPLASGQVGVVEAVLLLLVCLLVALTVVLALPAPSRGLCLTLAVATLPAVLLYPSAKRWFAYPQLVLAFCWGFAVLIPWAAATAALGGGWPLPLAWLATLLWTFGFDTVYAMADRADDAALGVRSSALSLGDSAPTAVALSYGAAALLLAMAATNAGVSWIFWPLWTLAAAGMQREAQRLRGQPPRSRYGEHFSRQVQLGALLLLALVLGRGA